MTGGEGRYRGTIAIVTGAGSGIGAALAEELVGRGAIVIATDIDASRLAPLRERIAEGAGTLITEALDVTDAEAFSAVARRAFSDHGRVDLLINNAGIGMAGEVRDSTLADWRRVIEVNTMGVIHGVDAVYRPMVSAGRGQIVNVASGAGLCPRPGMVPYATSKAAVVGLSLSLRAEAALHGVRVNVACPGYIATDILRTTIWRGVDGARLQRSIPIQPMTARDCAAGILRGAARDRPVIIVGTGVLLEWWIGRLSTTAGLHLASVRAKTFMRHRSE